MVQGDRANTTYSRVRMAMDRVCATIDAVDRIRGSIAARGIRACTCEVTAMRMPMAVSELTDLDREGFVRALDGIFEHSPWVAEETWPARPFATRAELHEALCAAMLAAPRERQLQLVRAHPELAVATAQPESLTAESTREQRGAGLDACTPAEFGEFAELGAAYREKMGFPFVIAVRGLGRAEILAALRARTAGDPAQEFREALAQVGRIAGFRLEQRFLA